MTFLVNVTQLVEYPLFLRHTILYFFILKILLGYQSIQAGGVLDGSGFTQSTQSFPTFQSVPSLLVIYSVSILAYSAQLFSFPPRHPGLWNHHSLLQL